MRRLSRKRSRQGLGPPPVVLALLALEMIAVIVLFVVGISLSVVAIALGPVTAVTMAFLSPWFQELGRRQPKLSVVAEQDRGDGTVDAPALRPWPVDVDRVVTNELAAARDTLPVQDGAVDLPARFADPMFGRPSDADHSQAHEVFEEQLPDFEVSLRDWLVEYSMAARKRSQTFDLTLRLSSARGSAHADAVTVVLDLPTTISVVEERPVVSLPPDRPCYEPPPLRLRGFWPVIPPPMPVVPRDSGPVLRERFLREPAWKVTADGQRLEASAGEVHAGRSVNVGKPLLLMADRAGRHEIRWTVYTRSALRPARGTITLILPPDLDRPAFGRLHGVTAYPDVPIIDRDGEVVHGVRGTDPPPQPSGATGTSDLREHLRQASAVREWQALGLDPADGLNRSAVIRDTPPVADPEE